MSIVEWISGFVAGRCPVCGDEDVKQQLLRAAIPGLPGQSVDVVTCGSCDSLNIETIDTELVFDDRAIDAYIEQFAGIPTIASSLCAIEPSSVKRFLDVGCNYGFAVDLGARLYGWETVGFDGSRAAERGARELGSDIRREVLTADSDIGDVPFDFILASEVIEHVANPLPFLSILSRHLAPGGTLILTTPSAAAVHRGVPDAVALSYLSPGLHVFLASRHGLARMLEDAGFASVDVQEHGHTLVATAAVRGGCVRPVSLGRAPDRDALERYYDDRANGATPGTALASGMAGRHYSSVVQRGDFKTAKRSRIRLDRTMKARYGFALDDFDAIRGTLDAGDLPPGNLTTVSFAAGMHELIDRRRPATAADHFAIAERACDEWRGHLGGATDLETLHLSVMAAAHEMLALAEADPAAVQDALARLDARAGTVSGLVEPRELAAVIAQTFTQLVSRAHYEEATRFEERVSEELPSLLDAGDHARHVGLDALFCRGMLALQCGSSHEAIVHFTECAHRTLDGLLDDDAHAAALHEEARRHVAIARSRSGSRAGGGVLYGLDVYWCDAAGIYLQGWALATDAPALEIAVSVGGRVVHAAGPHDRPDLAAFFPGRDDATRSGFRAYVPWRPTDRVVLEVSTALGARRIALELPDHPLPDWPIEANRESVRAALVQRINEAALPGPALALGTRGVTDEHHAFWRADLPGRSVFGVDIHAGPGVHVVGDVHLLSRFIRPRSVAIVVSDAMMEHVEAPWIVAREIHRVLVDGGLVMITAPTIWPEHAAPSDFWRFSTAGLSVLFGPRFGFEVICAGGFDAASVTLSPDARTRGHLNMPTLLGSSMGYALARKVSKEDDLVDTWRYDVTSGPRRAGEYPLDGVRQPQQGIQ